MLDKDRVAELFALLTDLDGEEAVRLRPISDNAADCLAARLREGADCASNMERICIAAAAWALCDYSKLGLSYSGADEVKVGDVSLRSAAGSAGRIIQDTEELRAYYLAGISDLLRPQFVFGQVPA